LAVQGLRHLLQLPATVHRQDFIPAVHQLLFATHGSAAKVPGGCRVGKSMNVESTGWRLTYPSEKYDSQLGVLFPIYGEKKHVPNHQPV